MSAKLSTEVNHRVREGRRALAAFEVEGPRAASGFLDTTQPHGESGDEVSHPGGFLTAVERTLRAALDHLVATDHAVARAAARESRLRRQRKADKRQLAFLIVALRRLVLAYYRDPDLDNLGLQPVNVRDAVTVLRRAKLLGERFAAINLARMLGEARIEATPAELGSYVDELRTRADELLALADEIDEAQRATDRARIERNRAKDDYDRVYLRGIRMFEDLCRFAGLDDLAATLRRRKRSKASSETSADTVGPSDGVTTKRLTIDTEASSGNLTSDSEERREDLSGPQVPEDESRDEETVRPPRAVLTAGPAEHAGLRSADLPGADFRAHAKVPEPPGTGPGRGPAPPVSGGPRSSVTTTSTCATQALSSATGRHWRGRRRFSDRPGSPYDWRRRSVTATS